MTTPDSLSEGDFAIQQLVAKLRVEALAVAVLPSASRLDLSHFRSSGDYPLSNRFDDELKVVVGAYVTRNAAQDEQVQQHIVDIGRVELAADPDRHAFERELVDHIKRADLVSIVSSVLDEVVGPDVIGPLRLSRRHEPSRAKDGLASVASVEP